MAKRSSDISDELLAYHRERFLRYDVPIVDDTARAAAKAERVAIADPLHILPQRYRDELCETGRQVLLLDQRYKGAPYAEEGDGAPVWHINLWPKGWQLSSDERRVERRQTESELLPWCAAMAEEAVAACRLFDAHAVIGVGRAGGIVAAEVAERLGLPMVLYLAAVEGDLPEESLEGGESEIMRDLAALWAEASAVRAANVVVSGNARFEEGELQVLDEYDTRHRSSVVMRVSPQWLCGALDALVARERGSYAAGWGEGFFARDGRAFHRATQVWRGDLPMIEDGHKKAASGLLPHLRAWMSTARERGQRLTVGFGGESGSGKTEIAGYLKLLFHAEGVHTVMIPGDAFFRRPPSENARERRRLADRARTAIEDYLTSSEEIDYARLEETIAQAKDRSCDIVHVPSDARRVDVGPDEAGRMVRQSRRYPDVPVYVKDVDIVFVDLTVSPSLESLDVRVFYEHTYVQKLERIERRNVARDPSFDFEFTKLLLEIEHSKIAPLKERANVLVGVDYGVSVVREPFS